MSGDTKSADHGLPRDDRVLGLTRALSLVIVAFLLAAFGILYLFPDRTGDLFAWTITPRMTPMMLGAAYLGGAYFFVRTATAGRWHTVTAGFPPVITFATLLGIATVLHWDRFNHHHVSFFAWVGLYMTTPFLVAAVWIRNRERDPRGHDGPEPAIPRMVSSFLVVYGVVLIGLAGLLFLNPGLAIRVWPWRLTELTSRVVAALFALAGVTQLSIALDGRWSAARVPMQGQMLALGAIIVAVGVSWSSFDAGKPVTWAFIVGMLLLLSALGGLSVVMDARGGRPGSVLGAGGGTA